MGCTHITQGLCGHLEPSAHSHMTPFMHPQLDPVAISIGPLSVHWYGLMYLVAFVLFVVLGRLHARRLPQQGWTNQTIDDLLFYGALGVVLGGRLGYVLFYKPGYYLAHPLEIFALWQGGMSFHGGLLGVLVGMAVYGRKHGRSFFEVTDFIAPLVPLGLAAGRLGNFINGELVGRVTDVPWAMIFPRTDYFPRHPSQLYQFACEGYYSGGMHQSLGHGRRFLPSFSWAMVLRVSWPNLAGNRMIFSGCSLATFPWGNG